jgi:hypothetical protein
LGGDQSDSAASVKVDADGNAFVAGTTRSTNLPITAGALQPTHGGEVDGFVAKLTSNGQELIYLTYLGGNHNESPNGVAVDASGNAYIAGSTRSTDFPTTEGAFQRSLKSAWGDAFILKLDANGASLLYSTYLGGHHDEDGDSAFSIAVDGAGNAYVSGAASSADFPTLNPLQPDFGGGLSDAFVAVLSAGGELLFSTYLGGSGPFREGGVLALDAVGNVYVAGSTSSQDFPTKDAFQPKLAGGETDGFVTRIDVELPQKKRRGQVVSE